MPAGGSARPRGRLPRVGRADPPAVPDKRNHLIADERQNRGTVDHTPLYPREVVKRALDLGATAIILVHNHPSGDATPSRADIEMTGEVREAAAKPGIALHGHLVIGRNGPASFKSLGLL